MRVRMTRRCSAAQSECMGRLCHTKLSCQAFLPLLSLPSANPPLPLFERLPFSQGQFSVLNVFTNAPDALTSPSVNFAPDATRRALSPSGLLQVACGSFCLAGALLFGEVAWAGEKIQITDSPEKIELPKDGKTQIPLEPRFLPPRIGSSESGKNTVMPQPNQPLIMRNPKLEERFDRRKNWMFDSPNSFDRDRAIEETFGIRKYELNNLEKRPKGAVERYLQSDKDDRTTSKSGRLSRELGREGLNPRDDFDPTARWSGRDDSDPEEAAPGIIPELNPAQLFDWNIGTDPAPQLGGFFRGNSALPRAIGESPFGQALPGQGGVSSASPGLREFERSWDYRKSPLGTPFGDPISGQPDATRAIMNPIAARKTSVPAPESSQGRFGDSFLPSSSSPASVRPDFLGPERTRSSSPMFSPPAAAPVRTPMMQPKPGVLEIPRPKF